MSHQEGCVRAVGALLTATVLAIAPTASAEEAAGPAFVDELAAGLQPLRSADGSDRSEAAAAGLSIDDGRVLVDVYVKGDPEDAAAKLRDLGMDVIATGAEPLAVVEGKLPLKALSASAKLGVSTALLPVAGVYRDVGAVTSQGVAAHNVPAAITAAGTSGAGIDVGVISDSIDRVNGGIADSQASGDLPPDPRVVVLEDDPDPTSSDEGRAMAEIIYDEAPGIDRILFNSGTLGAVSKAAGIDALVAAGADVIADDITYLAEPFFQDGQISQAADRAKAAGAAYFVSAGNRARQSYESTYREAGGLHDFDPDAGVDTRAAFSGTVPTNGNVRIFLQWDEPFGSATTDLDVRIVNNATGVVLGTQGNSNNLATGIPSEFASFTNPGAAVQIGVEILRTAGTRDPFMKWIEADNFSPTPVPQFDTQSATINPEAASANGTMAVAAVSASDSGRDTPESFSSRGPVVRFFDAAGARLATPEVRLKPNLAAADNVATTVPGFASFLGTSAAAPSAAGIAAILRSANPAATVNEIYAQMSDPANAIDCSSSALIPDPDCGAGFILADFAVAGLDRTPIAPTPITVPQKPNGRRGWFTKKRVGLSWDLTDPESPTEGASDCDPVEVTTDGTASFTCSATSGGGAGATTVTVKRDTKKPSKPRITGFKPGKPLPPKSKVRCKSKDKTSGLKSCKVKGYSSAPGKHRLKATATDRAGLKSKASLTYTVR